MKVVFTSTLFLVFLASPAWATLTCSDVQAAYQADAIYTEEYNCAQGNAACSDVQTSQLRATAVQLGDLTEAQAAATSVAELTETFQPQYSRLYLGNLALEGVSFDLGGNSFIKYFERGTTVLTPLAQDDGSVSVGDYCEVSLSPRVDETRKNLICEKIVEQVRAALPAVTYTVADCVSENTEFILSSESRTVAGVYASSNLAHVSAGYFSCSGELDRPTNVVSRLECSVH